MLFNRACWFDCLISTQRQPTTKKSIKNSPPFLQGYLFVFHVFPLFTQMWNAIFARQNTVCTTSIALILQAREMHCMPIHVLSTCQQPLHLNCTTLCLTDIASKNIQSWLEYVFAFKLRKNLRVLGLTVLDDTGSAVGSWSSWSKWTVWPWVTSTIWFQVSSMTRRWIRIGFVRLKL